MYVCWCALMYTCVWAFCMSVYRHISLYLQGGRDVCEFVCIYVCIQLSRHVLMYVWVNVTVYALVHACTCLCMYQCICINACMYQCIYIHVCECTFSVMIIFTAFSPAASTPAASTATSANPFIRSNVGRICEDTTGSYNPDPDQLFQRH